MPFGMRRAAMPRADAPYACIRAAGNRRGTEGRMSANTLEKLRGMLRIAALAFLWAASAAASDRIFVPGDGIGTSGDTMGAGVALSGDTAAVGIPQGSLTPHAAPGAIAIFRNVAGDWQREAFLGPGLSSAFALQQDMLVAGGPYVATYVRAGTTWSRHDLLDTPASSVALSGDTLLVSGTPAGVYTRVDGAWAAQATRAGDHPDERMASVALAGDVAVVLGYVHPGLHDEAYLHFYHRAGDAWTLESIASLAISPDENMLAIGMPTGLPGAGRVLTFVRANGGWTPSRTLVDDGPGNPGGADDFGAALAFFGENVFAGAPLDGAGGAVYGFSTGDAIFAVVRSGSVSVPPPGFQNVNMRPRACGNAGSA
jgi:hypothetical protein